MARRIKIFDTTLRDGEQAPGCSMNLGEKIEVAKQLEHLGVDVIEAGFAVASPGDLQAIQKIAAEIKTSTVCSLARCVVGDIDAAYEAVKKAESPRIHVFLATSPIHLQYKLKMSKEEVIERAGQMVAYAASKVSDVEFSAEDASRSDPAFLVKVLEAAIAAGAKTVNIPDTVGYSTPEEMRALIRYVKENTKHIDQVDLSVHCHNDLGMGVANSLAAVAEGATQIECTIGGIGERAGNAALEEIVMALHTREAHFEVETGIKTKQIYRSCKLLQSILGLSVPPNKAIVGANAFLHEAGIHQHGVLAERSTYEIMTPADIGIPTASMVLGKHSGRHAFEERLTDLGYHLTNEEIADAFERFKAMADRKKAISDRDIEAMLGHQSAETPGAYRLISFVINAGNTITATARVTLECEGKEMESVELGDGPIDAAFKAINRLIGRDFALHDYQVKAVTEGEDALGESTVKLSDEKGVKVTGRGISTDVIEASIKAYVNGVNKIFASE